jgi:hypothetical protein
MKVLLCGKCFDIKAFTTEFTACKCGNVEVRWIDASRGTFEAKAKVKQRARVIGMNNSFLYKAFDLPQMGVTKPRSDTEWQAAHDQATNAPGYLFDKAHRACWAGIFEIGATSDGKWAAGHEPVWKEHKEHGYVAYLKEDVHSASDEVEFLIEVYDEEWKEVRQLRVGDAFRDSLEITASRLIDHDRTLKGKKSEEVVAGNVVTLPLTITTCPSCKEVHHPHCATT